MNTLREALPEYLQLRRSLGFKLEDAGLLLPRFVAFLEDHGSTRITTALALAWAQQSASVQPAEWARRLCCVRGFARYRSAIDAQTEIPPHGLLPHRSTRARPYLYSDDEVQRLLDAASALPTAWHSTPLRPWAFHCLFGVLATTGLRLSEALYLQVSDVNLGEALLTIRGAKLGKTRLVPLHGSTTRMLADYLRRRQEFFARPISPYVFVSRTGNRLDQAHVHRTFYALSRDIGLRGAHASQGPRLHDFRHRFAVRVLTQWYQAGEDAARLLPVLSAYLGHVRVQDAALDAATPGQRSHDRLVPRHVQDAVAVRPEAPAQGAIDTCPGGHRRAAGDGVSGSRARRHGANAQPSADGVAFVLPLRLL